MRKFIILFIIFISLFLTTNCVQAQTQVQSEVEIYFFYGNTCPYCAQAKPVLEKFDIDNDWLHVKYYEVYDNQANAVLFDEFLKTYSHDFNEAGLPAFFVGNDLLMGYNEEVANMFEQKIRLCRATGCVSPLELVQKRIPAGGEVIRGRGFNKNWLILLVLAVLVVVVVVLLRGNKKNE